jgi:hypothetical protein
MKTWVVWNRYKFIFKWFGGWIIRESAIVFIPVGWVKRSETQYNS